MGRSEPLLHSCGGLSIVDRLLQNIYRPIHQGLHLTCLRVLHDFVLMMMARQSMSSAGGPVKNNVPTNIRSLHQPGQYTDSLAYAFHRPALPHADWGQSASKVGRGCIATHRLWAGICRILHLWPYLRRGLRLKHVCDFTPSSKLTLAWPTKASPVHNTSGRSYIFLYLGSTEVP